MTRPIPALLFLAVLCACGASPGVAPSATREPEVSAQPTATPNLVKEDCLARGGTYLIASNNCIGGATDPDATPRPTPTPRPPPTPEPTIQQAILGATVDIECGGTPCMIIVVSEVSEQATYPDPNGFYADEPQVPGNVFLQVFVEYRSLMHDASYGPFDWAIYADGQQLGDYTFVVNGPEPTLGSGTLPKDRTASGWLIYEVPPQGRIMLSYEPNFEGPPVYEIVVRSE